MGALAQAALGLVERAADAGMDRAGRLLSLTPREIDLELRALAERRRREVEALDLQAWLAGRYFLAALHAPRRYPRRPDGVQTPRRPMNDDEIKRVLINLAERRRESHGHS